MQLVVPQHRNEDIWVDLGVLESRNVVESVENFLNRLDASIFVGPLVQALRGRPHCNWEKVMKHESGRGGMMATLIITGLTTTSVLGNLIKRLRYRCHLPESMSVQHNGSNVTPLAMACTAPFNFRRALNRFNSSTVSLKCCLCSLSRS